MRREKADKAKALLEQALGLANQAIDHGVDSDDDDDGDAAVIAPVAAAAVINEDAEAEETDSDYSAPRRQG